MVVVMEKRGEGPTSRVQVPSRLRSRNTVTSGQLPLSLSPTILPVKWVVADSIHCLPNIRSSFLKLTESWFFPEHILP